MRTSILLLTVITLASVTVAQSKKDKLEIGVHTTSLSIFHPDFQFDDTQGGIGGRVTYNFKRSIAANAEINFIPQKQFVLNADGNAIQAQFGVKIGKHFEKFGLFGKVRPGFLRVDRVVSVLPGSQVPRFPDILEFPFGIQTPPNFRFVRKFHPSLDLGGVVEFYMSPRWMARFDVGDIIIRYGDISFPSVPFTISSATQHNLQVSSGLGFRF